MAIRYAVASGNWSAVGTWDGGATIPTVGDDVYCNGFDVTVDINIIVNKISTKVCPTTLTPVGTAYFKGVNVTLVCDIEAGSYRGFGSSATGSTINVIGNIYGGNGGGAHGLLAITGVGHVLNVVGNVYGGSNSTAYGIYYTNTTLNITGNVYGGSSTTAYGIYSTNGVAEINGSVYANTACGVLGGVTTKVVGNIYASATKAGYEQYAALYTLYMNGTIYNSLEIQGVNSSNLLVLDGGSITYRVYDESSNEIFIYSDFDQPAEDDVRDGVVFGIIYEGTCAVPPKASVALNVPVDDAVGELVTATTPQDFINALEASDLGIRLKECSTVDITGKQIAGS